MLIKSASSKGSELDDWTLRESGAASGTYTAEGKPRASEAGWRGMNKWGRPLDTPRAVSFKGCGSSRYIWIPESFSKRAALTLGVWLLGKLVIPEPPSPLI